VVVEELSPPESGDGGGRKRKTFEELLSNFKSLIQCTCRREKNDT
jgi:hypothetical protein